MAPDARLPASDVRCRFDVFVQGSARHETLGASSDNSTAILALSLTFYSELWTSSTPWPPRSSMPTLLAASNVLPHGNSMGRRLGYGPFVAVAGRYRRPVY